MRRIILLGTTALAMAASSAGVSLGYEGLELVAPNCDAGNKISAIRAVDAHTVTFEMCGSDPAFEPKAAFVSFGIQPSEHINTVGTTKDILSNPIGTGPYTLDSWNRGDSIILKRNDNYWGEKANAETLVFRWSTSGASQLNELRSGTVDQISTLSPDDFDAVKNDPDLQFLPISGPNTFYVGMNNKFAPFDNVKVRQAIAMGIDRQRIVDNYLPEGSDVAKFFTPCTIPNGCVGDEWYGFDPVAAKALLAEAGFPEGFKTKIFLRDVFRTYLPEPNTMAVELQSQLKNNLGIDAEVVALESGDFIGQASAGDLDGFHLLGWGADYPHITNFLDYHFGAEVKQFGNSFPEISGPLAEGATVADVEAAKPLYETANNAIRDLVPMIPISHAAAASAARSYVENAGYRPFGAKQFSLANPGKDTMVVMQNAEPISLYCGDESDGESTLVCTQIIETLLDYAQDSGSIVGGLATSCDANADATLWTCNLREGVKFSDGSDFDANDVVASYAAGLDVTNPAHVGNTGTFNYYSYLWGLINAPAK
ncbi:ABC transporter substrate-binding protein [Devosia sp. MC532]|uniref:ABC transporter substrate-binding protein n=1 Tax=Devosia sp. MC532 TaxID=2799788 RepID=UPI0032BF99B8